MSKYRIKEERWDNGTLYYVQKKGLFGWSQVGMVQAHEQIARDNMNMRKRLDGSNKIKPKVFYHYE